MTCAPWFRSVVLFFSGLLVGSFCCAWESSAYAAPRCELAGQPYLEGRVRSGGNATHAARAVDARLGQEIEVFVVAPGLFAGRKVIFSEDGSNGHVSYLQSGCEPI